MKLHVSFPVGERDSPCVHKEGTASQPGAMSWWGDVCLFSQRQRLQVQLDGEVPGLWKRAEGETEAGGGGLEEQGLGKHEGKESPS